MVAERPARRRTVVRLVAACAVLAVLSGGFIAYTGYQQTSGPAGAVRGYFAALARGDAPAALAFGQPPPEPRTLLTSTVLRQQLQIAPISGVRIIGTVRRGARATVTVQYRLGFRADPLVVTEPVVVLQHAAVWRLATTAANTALVLAGALDRATIAGAAVPQSPVSIFPGALPIAFDTPYLRLALSTRTVLLSAPQDMTVMVDVSPAGRAVIVPAITRMLSACLSAAADPRCPLPSNRIVPGTLRGTLARNALAHLQLQVQTDQAGVIGVSADAVGVRASYQQLDFDNQPFPMSGAVTLQIAATTYAVAPLHLNWSNPS